MKDRQSRSVRRNTALVAILIFVCAVGSIGAIQFVGIPFLRAGSQPSTISVAQQVAEVTATYGPDEDPPPPPLPTGTIVWSLPTPDYSLDERAPTAEFDPSLPTLEPTIEPEYIPMEVPPFDAVAPNGEIRTYTNSDIGFSFDYPANWNVEEGIGAELPEGRETLLVIRNYTHGNLKGDMTTDQIRANIYIGLPGSVKSLEEWVGRYLTPKIDVPESSFKATALDYFEIAGVPAVRWTQTAEAIPQGNVIVGFRKNGRMYVFSSYPATSKYVADLDQIIASFKFP